jgi:hypothetical protein
VKGLSLMRSTRFATALLLLVAGSSAAEKNALVIAKGEVPEAQLVDVSIDLFAPGVSDTPPSPMLQKGIRASVRKSESRYIPTHLRNTLQSTGQWGAVRVVPGGAGWGELLVTGKILKSNGKDLELELRASDATGRVWLDRKYAQAADVTAYAKERPLDGHDPFQALYNRTANDLLRERERRKPKELADARAVAEMRFAAYMAPDPFASYVATDRSGATTIVRLPATDDPMLARVRAVRERDHMLIDTLNEFYADFYARMDKPYDDWRAYSYEEQKSLDSIERNSLIKKIGGAIAVLAGVFLLDPRDDHGAKDVMILGGIAAIDAGFKQDKDKDIHKASLSELADSFEGEITPLLVDVDGKVVQLTGSAEGQYQKWRDLLQQIAETDAPLPNDINVLPMAPAEVVKP